MPQTVRLDPVTVFQFALPDSASKASLAGLRIFPGRREWGGGKLVMKMEQRGVLGFHRQTQLKGQAWRSAPARAN